MRPVLIVVGILLVLDLVWFLWAYNKLVKARNQMREGGNGIEVQRKRRHDLVPGLVECVKGYQWVGRRRIFRRRRRRGRRWRRLVGESGNG